MVLVTFQRLNVLEPFQNLRKFIHWALPIFLTCKKVMSFVLRDPNFINDCKNPANEHPVAQRPSKCTLVHKGLFLALFLVVLTQAFSTLTLLISEAQ